MTKRIAITGFSGSGKTTLAKRLKDAFNLPIIGIDSLCFTEDWNMKPREEIIGIMLEACSAENWVLDGLYRRLADPLIGNFDLLIFIDIGFFTNTKNLIKRKIKGLIRVIRTRRRRARKVSGFRNFKVIWVNRKDNRANWIKFLEENKDSFELIKIRKVNRKTINQVIEKVEAMNGIQH